MAKAGEVIDNPITGERIVVIQTAQDTNGELFAFEFSVKPHGFLVADHIHPKQEEAFEVTKGTIGFRINGKEATASPGQVVVIPPGTLHGWWNASDDEASARVSFRPALNIETFFETAYGLARDGKTNKHGRPNILQIAVILSDFRDTVQLPLSPPLQVLMNVLTPLARLLGYRSSYSRYSSPEQRPEAKLPAVS